MCNFQELEQELNTKIMQKSISSLKQGDKLYSFSNHKVESYTYQCVHPTGRGKYHILIDSNQEPVRMYEDRLQAILDMDLKTNQSAWLALAEFMEKEAKAIRKSFTICT